MELGSRAELEALMVGPLGYMCVWFVDFSDGVKIGILGFKLIRNLLKSELIG